MLEIKGLHASYGTIEALKGIDINVEAGKITCLVGNNGAAAAAMARMRLLKAACAPDFLL